MAKDLKEQIEIMTHYLNGGEIEICKNDEWLDITNPEFKDWNFAIYGFRIKEQKNTITIEKWLTKHRHTERVEIIEGNNKFFEAYNSKYEKIKLLETYEVEL